MALIKKLASGYLILIYKILYAFVSVPVLIKYCGDYNYGVFLITFGISGTLSFFDFGIGVSTTRVTTLYRIGSIIESYDNALSKNLVLNILLGLVVFFISILFAFFPVRIFSIDNSFELTTKLLFSLGALNAFFLIIDNFAVGVCYGFDDYEKRNYFQLGFQITNMLGLILVAYFRLDILYFAIFTVVTTIFCTVSDFVIAFRNLRRKKVRLSLKGLNLKLGDIGYNIDLFKLSILSFISTQSDKLILSFFTNPHSIVIHSIVTKPAFFIKSLSGTLFTFLQPKYIEKEDSSLRLKNMLSDLTLGVYVMLFYSLVFYWFFYDDFVFLWVKSKEYSKYLIWGFLALSNVMISGLVSPIFKYFVNSNQIKKILRYDICLSLINILISISLTKFLGFGGVLVGTFIQLLFLFGFLFFEAKKLDLHTTYYVLLDAELSLALFLTVVINYVIANFWLHLSFDLLNFVVQFFLSIISFIFVLNFVGSIRELKKRILK